MIPIAQKAAAELAHAARCVILGALLLAAPAFAEKADREKPINIEADRVTVDDAKQISTFEGRVVLTQGTLVIRGDRMEVRQDSQGFNSGITWGNLAYFRQKREGHDEIIEGWAERIEYDSRADKLQMFNRASMKKTGGDEVHGNYISYDGNTEFFQVIGGGAKAAESRDGRVRAVLQPKPKAKPEPQPPVSLKPEAMLSSPRGELTAPR
ncbi:MAG: lipopolysaccharide transport periplasmic protein LptA [Burkholderiales bacterium]|nr:lipopolysaccharide transport periplasmic protein LptA [Burkholderiales bacterium]MDP2399202.1 lipopolysaccharide transport periplasmic protein LptA [Burkholderiales bacterium]